MKQLYTMSQKEIARLEILQKLINREMRQRIASELLCVSVRQVQRLLRAYNTNGVLGLISKKRSKPSNNRTPNTVREYVLKIIMEKYRDFGPTLAAEKLSEKHDVNLSIETIRQIMITGGIWISRDKKRNRSYQPRYRRERFGELIQIDGSTHHWFEDRGPKCTLLVFVDDATSKITSLHFAPTESLHTYCIAARQHIERYGKPIAFYSDKFSVFRPTKKELKDKILTQFGRALYELNIDLICANTCQAKGRVERANLTLQDRLIKELRLNNISTIETANAYLPNFIADYNCRFGKAPGSSVDAHRPLNPTDDLQETLCVKSERTVSNNLTLQYDMQLYLIEDSIKNRGLRRKKVIVHEYNNGKISLNYRGERIKFRPLYDKEAPIVQGEVVANERINDVLVFIQNRQHSRDEELKGLSDRTRRHKLYKRSVSCPSRRHLNSNFNANVC